MSWRRLRAQVHETGNTRAVPETNSRSSFSINCVLPSENAARSRNKCPATSTKHRADMSSIQWQKLTAGNEVIFGQRKQSSPGPCIPIALKNCLFGEFGAGLSGFQSGHERIEGSGLTYRGIKELQAA